MAKKSTFTERAIMLLISAIDVDTDPQIKSATLALAKEHGLGAYAARVLQEQLSGEEVMFLLDDRQAA